MMRKSGERKTEIDERMMVANSHENTKLIITI